MSGFFTDLLSRKRRSSVLANKDRKAAGSGRVKPLLLEFFKRELKLSPPRIEGLHLADVYPRNNDGVFWTFSPRD